MLWQDWSPTWADAARAFAASAPSLHNPDFVDVVLHSYRHRYGLAEGDPRYDGLERRLAEYPPITVPAVVIQSGADGIPGPSAADDRELFVGSYEHRFLPDVGHNVPQEDPEAFTEAVLAVLARP